MFKQTASAVVATALLATFAQADARIETITDNIGFVVYAENHCEGTVNMQPATSLVYDGIVVENQNALLGGALAAQIHHETQGQLSMCIVAYKFGDEAEKLIWEIMEE